MEVNEGMNELPSCFHDSIFIFYSLYNDYILYVGQIINLSPMDVVRSSLIIMNAMYIRYKSQTGMFLLQEGVTCRQGRMSECQGGHF